MDVSLPAFAHRVTVLGSTRNMVATSAGVSSGSASGVRADMYGLSSWTGTAIPAFPLLFVALRESLASAREAAWDVLYSPLGPILPSPTVTCR